MLTSSATEATVNPTPGDSDAVTPEETILSTVTELAARWHRHADDPAEFWGGARAGWAQALSLLLGVPYGDVNRALASGDL